MRKIIFVLSPFLLFVSFLFPHFVLSSSQRMPVVVVEFDVKGDLGMEDAGRKIAEFMSRSVAKTDKFAVEEKVLLKSVLTEQGLQAHGLLDGRTASRIGSIYGVKGLIIGSAVKVGEVISLRVRLMDANFGAILKEADVNTYDTQDIPAGLDEIAHLLAGETIEKEKPAQKVESEIPHDMVLIKGGCFQMGDILGEGEADERPVHEVCLDAYYIDRYEVTQMEYETVFESNPSRFLGKNNPVEKVTWKNANEYCEKAGKRLPTEAEWEYAAREGGKKVRFGTGTDAIGSDIVNFDARAQYNEEYSETGEFLGKTVSVGSYKPNALGLYDMSGNVWEWVADWYSKDYYSVSPRDNPKGPLSGDVRVLRGGSWNDTARNLRATYRGWSNPRWITLNGFRCARDS